MCICANGIMLTGLPSLHSFTAQAIPLVLSTLRNWEEGPAFSQ